MLVLDSCSTHGSARDDDEKNHGLPDANHSSPLLLFSHSAGPSSSFARVALSGETRVFLGGPGCGCHDAVTGGG